MSRKGANRKERCAVFFDIDGTLISTHGAGRRAFAVCLERVFGIQDDLEHLEFAGGTDRDLLSRIMAHHQIRKEPELERAFFQCLPRALEELLAERPATPLPGVARLLRELAAEWRFVVGLLTGNIPECAEIKLRSAGLHQYFVLGAYGREHADRRDIARLALQKLREYLKDRLPPIIWVVGDTVYDIQAAHAIGALALAVASVRYTQSDLRAAGADVVVDTLEDFRAEDFLRLAPVKRG